MTRRAKPKKNMKGRPRGGASVPCPACGKNSRVVITRRVYDTVERRRMCIAKRPHEFLTTETVQ
jgi:hypothetical protein